MTGSVPLRKEPCFVPGARVHRSPVALIVLLGGCALLGAGSLRAQQSPSPNQPVAIPDQVRMQRACPLIVPQKDFALQPLRIPPAQVPMKNAMGCLSPADAIYGPDGCPARLCGKGAGTMPLPAR